jgi:hypothetical protein
MWFHELYTLRQEFLLRDSLKSVSVWFDTKLVKLHESMYDDPKSAPYPYRKNVGGLKAILYG